MNHSDTKTTQATQRISLMFQATQIQWPQLCIYPSGHMSVSLNEQWTHLALWVCCECTGSTYTPPADSLHTAALQTSI